MKQFISKILLFLALACLIDFLYGALCDKLSHNAIGGDSQKIHYISEKCDEDVLIFGSSRSNHHYISSLIGDRLNMTCYNCGVDGNGIVLMCGFLNLISEYNTPKIIIYDITHSFDLQINDNVKYLGRLKPYAQNSNIRDLFMKVEKKEVYKTFSKMYQYNSKLLQLISDNVNPLYADFDGYRPLYKTMDYEPKSKNNDEMICEYDQIKIQLLEDLILKCKKNNTKLFFTTSPYYLQTNNNYYIPVRDLCNKYNLPFIEHHNDTTFVGVRDYFSDSVHLNHEGATIFTNKVIEEILLYLQKNSKPDNQTIIDA